MTNEQIKQLTEEYNNKRYSFNFITMGASESGIASILKLNPEIEKMDNDSKIRAIAIYLHNLAFG